MPLSTGSRIGPYEIVAALGAGGMGEVYRAKDSKLKREVALKVLPADVASDRERMARFQREAEVLASLNHPNIAQIYGLEEGADVASGFSRTTALVMELVEGEDLAERLKRGPIPIDEALPIARQIAEALEAAHEQGIIHRDLKPANVKVRPDGTVKVLDFGLAKAFEPGSGVRDPGSAHLANSPTITSPAMTMHGMILGTAAYMAPEQAKGKAVDKRADIWAFGVVLCEMLTGRKTFEGEDITDTLTAVMRDTPDWSALPAETPAAIRTLLRRSIEKDPRKRIPHIAVARLEIEDAMAPPGELVTGAEVAPPPRRASPLRAREFAPWVLAALLALALAATWTLTGAPPAPASSRYPIALADGQRVGPTTWAPMTVSPDGSRLVYVGESGRLMVRSREQIDSAELAGTDGAFNPFFSPDGARVGFMSGPAGNAQLRSVPIAGGPPALITADTVGGPGASWGTDGYIYYDTSGVGPLRRVKESGGNSEVVSTLDAAGGELQHDWPDALPGGKGVLITINRGGPGVNISQSDDVGVLDLATGRHRVLVHGVLGRYAASGHIVYVTAEGILMAAPFDELRLEVTGNSVALLEGINMRIESGGIDIALSRSGTLWYATGSRQGRQEVLWATPAGEFSALEAGWTGAFESLALSPDATKLALTITDSLGQQLWLKDLTRPGGPLSKVTHERANKMPRWHPDGTRLTFVSDLAGKSELRSTRVDGNGEQTVLADELYVLDGGWTMDGRWLVYSGQSPAARVFREDIHGRRLGEDAKSVPLAATAFNERRARISPDGRWMVFEANPTGRPEIYVRPFPETSASQSPVSSGGGSWPKWSRDGREIYYVNGANQLTRVAVVPGPTFAVGKPNTLFSLAGVQDWDVAADGRIILIRAAEANRGGQLIVVENFLEELRRKVPR